MICLIASCPHHSLEKSLCALETPPIDGVPPNPRNRSLVIASLELGRVLADRGQVTFRTYGTCMFPCIHPGDLLHIQSRTIDQVQVGDIAVFRRNTNLFGHRAIDKGFDNGKPYIVTRPDRTRQGDDGPTYGDDVLGVVTVIERGGAHMPPQPQPLHGMAALRTAVWEWWNWEARVRWINRLERIAQCVSYGWLVSAWLHLARPQQSYLVRVPLNANQSLDLYREFSPDEFDVSQPTWQGRPATSWTLALHLNGARPPAVSATINWHPEGCPRGAGWHVDEMQTRLRYRGAGLDNALIAQAEVILERSGMTLHRKNL